MLAPIQLLIFLPLLTPLVLATPKFQHGLLSADDSDVHKPALLARPVFRPKLLVRQDNSTTTSTTTSSSTSTETSTSTTTLTEDTTETTTVPPKTTKTSTSSTTYTVTDDDGEISVVTSFTVIVETATRVREEGPTPTEEETPIDLATSGAEVGRVGTGLLWGAAVVVGALVG